MEGLVGREVKTYSSMPAESIGQRGWMRWKGKEWPATRRKMFDCKTWPIEDVACPPVLGEGESGKNVQCSISMLNAQ